MQVAGVDSSGLSDHSQHFSHALSSMGAGCDVRHAEVLKEGRVQSGDVVSVGEECRGDDNHVVVFDDFPRSKSSSRCSHKTLRPNISRCSSSFHCPIR